MLFWVQEKAKQAGLFNLFLPAVSGLTQLDYAYIAEETGRCIFAPEIFNCQAPGRKKKRNVVIFVLSQLMPPIYITYSILFCDTFNHNSTCLRFFSFVMVEQKYHNKVEEKFYIFTHNIPLQIKIYKVWCATSLNLIMLHLELPDLWRESLISFRHLEALHFSFFAYTVFSEL